MRVFVSKDSDPTFLEIREVNSFLDVVNIKKEFSFNLVIEDNFFFDEDINEIQELFKIDFDMAKEISEAEYCLLIQDDWP